MPNDATFVNVSYNGNATNAIATASHEDYVRARDIANSIPIFSGTDQHATLDEFEYAVRVNLAHIPTTDGKKEEYIYHILKRILPPAKLTVTNKSLYSVEDILKILIKRYRNNYDLTYYANKIRCLLKFSNEPLECFLDRLAALVQCGLRAVENQDAATKSVYDTFLNQTALNRFKEYGNSTVNDILRIHKPKKISDLSALLEDEDLQSPEKVPALEIPDNGRYRYATEYPSIQGYPGLSNSAEGLPQAPIDQHRASSVVGYQPNYRGFSQKQGQSDHFTPIPQRTHSRGYYRGPRPNDTTQEALNALVREYIPSRRNGQPHSPSLRRPTDPPPPIPNQPQNQMFYEPIYQNIAMGTAPQREYGDSGNMYGRQRQQEEVGQEELPDPPEVDVTQLEDLAKILAMSQKSNRNTPIQQKSSIEKPSAELSEIGQMLKSLTLAVKEQGQQFSQQLNQLSQHLISRSSSRSNSRERGHRNGQQYQSPATTTSNLNGNVARQEGATPSYPKQDSHILESTHSRQ